MVESRKVIVVNKGGIHAGPASVIVQATMDFDALVYIEHKGRVIDASSILDILTLGVQHGTEVTIQAEGADALPAIERLESLFINGFEIAKSRK